MDRADLRADRKRAGTVTPRCARGLPRWCSTATTAPPQTLSRVAIVGVRSLCLYVVAANANIRRDIVGNDGHRTRLHGILRRVSRQPGDDLWILQSAPSAP